jgi:hypothetical protein
MGGVGPIRRYVRMKRSRWLLAAVLSSFPLLGSCTSTGDECDVCTVAEDCKAGLVCADFVGETTKRCASGTGSTTCRVR